MGDDMPTGFGVNYLDRRITPGLPGPELSGRDDR
jgi:hypothetical protein